MEKLWKKIIKISIEQDEENKKNKFIEKNHPAFFTQLVYRLSQIKEFKYKRVFLSNFFRTAYFKDIIPSKYTLSDNDFNYICYIYKVVPERRLTYRQEIVLIKFLDMFLILYSYKKRNRGNQTDFLVLSMRFN